MIRLKVRGGTLPDKRLCDSCRYSQVMKHSDGSERIVCSSATEPIEINQVVVECSEYANKTQATLHQLEKIGWILDIKGKTILGFKPPKKIED